MTSKEGTPHDLAVRIASRRSRRRVADGFVRQTFVQPREAARETARAFFGRYPKAAYMTEVEAWRELPDGEIEFTMRRLSTAD